MVTRGWLSGREEVAVLSHPLEHLVVAELLETERVLGTLLDLRPRDGCGDERALDATQGVRRDGGLGAGVLRPVEEDLPRALGLGHGGGDQLRVLGLELLGDLLGQRRRLVGVAATWEVSVHVEPLAAAGHRAGVELALAELVADQERYLA